MWREREALLTVSLPVFSQKDEEEIVDWGKRGGVLPGTTTGGTTTAEPRSRNDDAPLPLHLALCARCGLWGLPYRRGVSRHWMR